VTLLAKKLLPISHTRYSIATVRLYTYSELHGTRSAYTAVGTQK